MQRYVNTPSTVAFQASRIAGDIPADGAALEHTHRALRLVSAIHSLEEQESDSFSRTHRELRIAAAEELDIAARELADSEVSEHFRLRAAGLRDGDFIPAREYNSRLNAPSIELILGPIASWRERAGTSRYSATLAIRSRYADALDFQDVDANVRALVDHYLVKSGAISSAQEPLHWPEFNVCDILDFAGESAQYPHHFANFLPEDDGLTGTTRTVVYQNYHLARVLEVSLPLLSHVSAITVPNINQREARWPLLAWLRAHDLAHGYFDIICHRAGLPDRTLHVARELLADMIGLLAVENGGSALACLFVAEAVRYSLRDAELFADSVAAQVELAALIDEDWENATNANKQREGATSIVESVLSYLLARDDVSFERYLQKRTKTYERRVAQPHILTTDLIPVADASSPVATATRSSGPAGRIRTPHCGH